MLFGFFFNNSFPAPLIIFGKFELMMSEVLEDVLGKERPMAFLSGPSFAMEIAQGLATAVTIASSDRDLGNDVMSLLKSRQFRGLCALARAPQPHPAARCAPSPLGPCRA